MGFKVKVHINREEIRKAGKELAEKFNEGVADMVDYAATRSQELVPVDNSPLKISMEVVHDQPVFTHTITYHSDHAAYVEYGTGIFSTHPQATRRPITPQNKKVLAWVTAGRRPAPEDKEGWRVAKQQGRAVIAKSIKGQKPQPFLRPAVDEAMVKLEGFVKAKFD